MIDGKTLCGLEYDKILSLAADRAVLAKAKAELMRLRPCADFREAASALSRTEEAYILLFEYGLARVEFFEEFADELERAEKGFSLGMGELLKIAALMRSSRVMKNEAASVSDGRITYISRLADGIYADRRLEEEIFSKIISDEALADNASARLFELRRLIKSLNAQIRDRLNEYLRSGDKFLQDNVVTVRNDRYVIPVKAERRNEVRGFVHDRSATGSTVFIEPVEVLELNNRLRMAVADEALEVAAILKELTEKVGFISGLLTENINILTEIDCLMAKADYAYATKSVKPELTNDKIVNIIGGRHPLIDSKRVVPLNVKIGDGYKYLLITGPNTGGKTVTLKLTGLFVLMAMSGLFLPAEKGTSVSVFGKIFCDIGDEQSIEQSLSTFSSHVRNLVNITENVDESSLVLIDEIGAGTDPDEGSALAEAVIKYLLAFGSSGIITTHYSLLKEFAFGEPKLMNASMDFDAKSFSPLYKLNIGLPGSSNAIEIASRLGLNDAITAEATSLLSVGKVSFENVLKEAERARLESEKTLEEYRALTEKAKEEYEKAKAARESLDEERQRFFAKAKSEARRIVGDKTAEAEELVEKIKEILEKEEITSGDLIKARTLKNQLENSAYSGDEESETPLELRPLAQADKKTGKRVFVKSLEAAGEIVSVDIKHKRLVVDIGGMKFTVKDNAVFDFDEKPKKRTAAQVTVHRETSNEFNNQLNVIGMDRSEALYEVENFIDSAVLHNAETVYVIHGVGLKVLSSAIHAYLKKHPSVKEFRFGKYGEGENGVTVVTLK